MITIKKILAPAVLSLALAIGFTGMKAEAAPSVTRIDGGSGGRIQTADNLAKTQFTSSQNVILVYGYNYADAVSATPLAKQLDAPILITKGDELESEVADTIKSLGAKKVYIVGGSGVVSDNVENKLKGSGYDVERIAGYTDADGNVDTTRTGTNAAVAKKVFSMSGQKTAMLVYGYNYPDALSVAALAAQKGYPVLFADTTGVSDSVKEIAKNFNKIYAVGGDAVLPSSVVKSVNATKITGNTKDRYDTNTSVLEYFRKNYSLDFSKVYVATGGRNDLEFADALVASAAAAKENSPLLLSGYKADDATLRARNYLLGVEKSPSIVIVGGSGAVSNEAEECFRDEDPFEVIGVE